MRIVIQRVRSASVTVDQRVTGSIGQGLLLLLGVGGEDHEDDVEWLVKKVVAMRIFDDSEGVMNLSVRDIDGEALVVSQFALMASTKKGNRPSYIHAAPPDYSVPLYELFCRRLSDEMGKKVPTGIFGADMQVALVNDGPVTICMDSKRKE